MYPSLRKHIKNLKSALRTLQATGEIGFEGLIGATLCEISGVPFRLAGSGSQFGVDGKPTYERDAICFEGKRYDNRVPRTEVISKIAELSIHDNETDIWVLGATSQIPSQLADVARELGRKNGIFILILDWLDRSETDLPPLAVALAMGGTRVEKFLQSNIRDDKKFREAFEALEAIKNSQDFDPHADRIRDQCSAPSVGNALARLANTDWLIDTFSSRARAKRKLGQPLSPGDADTANVRQRNTLIDQLHPYFTAALDETVVYILGSEGNGKSWIVAQSWLSLEYKPLMIFMSPDYFAETAWQDDVTELLIGKLIEQTDDQITESTRERWRRRLGQWRNQPATDSPRLIVVIDGINQRPNIDWARNIERIIDELSQFGGRLIVTARTSYFRTYVQGRLEERPTEILVPEWTKLERDEILAAHGLRPSDLHHSVAGALRNPRLLGIALEILDKSEITEFEELSVSRLLFEHIRMSERDAPMLQPAFELVQRLRKHAQEILSRVKAQQLDDLNIFEDEVAAVVDGRFFHEVDGDPTRYALKDEGLRLALGFAVIDRLNIAQRNGHNLDNELDAILEPITALDDTADVILAALTVTTLDATYPQNITVSLVKGFAVLQNPDSAKFSAFAAMAKRCPQGFMDAAAALCLSGGHQPNFDWIKNALISACKDNSVWPEMTDKVRSWLSVYSLAPEGGSVYHPEHDSAKRVSP